MAIITSVQNQSSDLLTFLSNRDIHIGTKVEVKQKLSFDNSLEVKIKNKQSFHVSEQVASAIRVNPL
jgi:DtxR family Mn-dependent transcriptional regulator